MYKTGSLLLLFSFNYYSFTTPASEIIRFLFPIVSIVKNKSDRPSSFLEDAPEAAGSRGRDRVVNLTSRRHVTGGRIDASGRIGGHLAGGGLGTSRRFTVAGRIAVSGGGVIPSGGDSGSSGCGCRGRSFTLEALTVVGVPFA